MTRPSVIITTRLPPAVCGIGTYSAILRKHWPNEQDGVQFLVVGEAAGAEQVSADDTITECAGDPRRLLEALRRIGAADVLLHYAGRAYHRFGCPTWLPTVLATWKREFPESRLMVFVHEMPAPMPVTSRHFWLGLLNTRIIRRLAAIADVVATNTDNHARQLRQFANRPVEVVAIGANIESSEIAPTDARQRGEFVVFGLSFGRLQTLEAFDAHVRRWIASGRLTQLHLIGPGGDKFSAEADRLIAGWTNPAVVVRHGALPSAEVSRLLTRAEFALTNVTAETWSKSGAFMACAAHGCAVVRTGPRAEAAPLADTFVPEEVGSVSAAEVQQRTSALAAWYNENAAWPIVAAKLAARFAREEQGT